MSATAGRFPAQVGRYRISAELSSDQTQEMYLAFDPLIERPVVIQVFPLELGDAAAEREIRQMFYQEMQRTGALEHPNITTLFDAGELPELLFMATEFVEAPRLSSLVDADPGWDLQARLAVLSQIVDGLEYARETGLPHLHLRPAYVLVDADRSVKIAGFGVARVMSAIAAASGAAGLDRSPYASPERARGEPGDHRSDVFSVARIALDLLAPSFDFAQDRPAPGVGALPAYLSELGVNPDRWLAVFERALADDPAERFDAAAELEVELLLMLGAAAVPGHSAQTSQTFFGPIPRRSPRDKAGPRRESDLEVTKAAAEPLIFGQTGDDPKLPSRSDVSLADFGNRPAPSASNRVDRKR